jgi:hypothetical protein
VELYQQKFLLLNNLFIFDKTKQHYMNGKYNSTKPKMSVNDYEDDDGDSDYFEEDDADYDEEDEELGERFLVFFCGVESDIKSLDCCSYSSSSLRRRGFLS